MLIRDQAPVIAAQNGAVLKTRTLSNEEFRETLFATLRNKLDALEAATKLSEKDRTKTLTNELANFFELTDGFMANEGLAPDDVYHEQRRQRDEPVPSGIPKYLGLGSFRKRLFLVEGMIKFHKLVRDKVPARIRAKGQRCVDRPLREDEKDGALDRKASEEILELLVARALPRDDSSRRAKVIHELADVFDVLSAMLKRERISLDEVRAKMLAIREERGGFDEFIMLEEAEPVR